ncbi:hypothetical protein DPMN_174313 [Dreissena polymorpha]|uniref:Uncharacterized protein n=1 Tax=Dreissena polymorpha TaxID=45954 RepID=A0A9D4E6W0_DREPO|nr:hypothetical protein DPMN_174313 [Dreissena polymorpha]
MSVYPTDEQKRTLGGTGGHADGKTYTRTVEIRTHDRRHEQMSVLTYGRTVRKTDRQTDVTLGHTGKGYTDERTDGKTDVRTEGHAYDVTISYLTRTECSE